jgi:hypothetical protein
MTEILIEFEDRRTYKISKKEIAELVSDKVEDVETSYILENADFEFYKQILLHFDWTVWKKRSEFVGDNRMGSGDFWREGRFTLKNVEEDEG